jgi:hypothetical protein
MFLIALKKLLEIFAIIHENHFKIFPEPEFIEEKRLVIPA